VPLLGGLADQPACCTCCQLPDQPPNRKELPLASSSCLHGYAPNIFLLLLLLLKVLVLLLLLLLLLCV
jgi:hypothetical protein